MLKSMQRKLITDMAQTGGFLVCLKDTSVVLPVLD